MNASLKTGRPQRQTAISATKLFPFGPQSEPHQLGRRLVLKFGSEELPELDRIEFHASASPKHEFRQSGGEDTSRSFRATKVSKALPIFFLDYLCARLKRPPGHFLFEGGSGTLAAALGNGIADKNGCWGSLFVEFLPAGEKADRREKIFGGKNWGGKPAKHRIIFVKHDYLPPDCFEVFWNGTRLNEPDEIRHLTQKFRNVWKLPPPSELNFPEGEESDGKIAAPANLSLPPAAPSEPVQQKSPSKATEPTITAELGGQKQNSTPDAKTAAGESTPSPDRFSLPQEPTSTRIDPRLFEIQNPDRLEWDDSDGLINFGRADSDADIWKLRDANEGVLILGAVGSGKTSGSGAAIASALLLAGYGGLVLTAKSDEAKRWLRLCERTGRAQDCIHVTPGTDHKLNVFQYEVQRPGKRVSVADDLVALLRCINGVTSRSMQSSKNNDFWTLAPNKLIKQLFEMFALSGEPFSINNFTRFVNRAPQTKAERWQEKEYFAKVINSAGNAAKNGSEADQRMFNEAFEYWTKSFPAMPDITRGGVVASFDSMAEIMNGRGIYEMLCTETNLTPEMILSGKIVILDYPVKESSQSGLMIQATWKLLLQQAIERRADKGSPTARPVFLWEDEGHEFFSSHDVRFQPTARDCRACHVILSQNLHNFYHLGHGSDAVQAVFAAMNTHIFHTNGDPDTNAWASQKIGTVKKKHWRTDGLIKGFTKEDHSILNRKPAGETKSVGSLTITKTEEPGMRPEEFGKLKKGGDGTCEAVILWLAHEFAVNNKMNFCKRVIQQEKREDT